MTFWNDLLGNKMKLETDREFESKSASFVLTTKKQHQISFIDHGPQQIKQPSAFNSKSQKRQTSRWLLCGQWKSNKQASAVQREGGKEEQTNQNQRHNEQQGITTIAIAIMVFVVLCLLFFVLSAAFAARSLFTHTRNGSSLAALAWLTRRSSVRNHCIAHKQISKVLKDNQDKEAKQTHSAALAVALNAASTLVEFFALVSTYVICICSAKRCETNKHNHSTSATQKKQINKRKQARTSASSVGTCRCSARSALLPT